MEIHAVEAVAKVVVGRRRHAGTVTVLFDQMLLVYRGIDCSNLPFRVAKPLISGGEATQTALFYAGWKGKKELTMDGRQGGKTRCVEYGVALWETRPGTWLRLPR